MTLTVQVNLIGQQFLDKKTEKAFAGAIETSEATMLAFFGANFALSFIIA